MPVATAVAERVRSLLSELDGGDLSPHPQVTAGFEELVGLALRHRSGVAERVLGELGSDADRVRRLCARGEAALERHWAERVTAAPDPGAELARFPYRENYRRLVALELAIVHGLGGTPRHATVLGSGPLPMTGVELAGRHGLAVVLVDREEEALYEGDALVKAVGLDDKATSVHADAGVDPLDLAPTDLVVHGALVGSDPAEKHAILRSVAAAMRPGAHLVTRSAAGLRELLYPRASVDGVPGLRLMLEAHPHDDVVNSVLVAVRE